MKIFKYSLIICLLSILTYCTPDNEGSFGDTVDREAQIMGTWKIQSVFQVDLEAEKKSFPGFTTKMDITNVLTGMPYSDFTMNIQKGIITTTNGNSPMSYIISEGSGTWSWITNEEINLVNQQLGINASSGIAVSINGQNVNLHLASYAGISDETPVLSLNYERFDSDDNLVMRYEYILIKQ